MVEHAADFEWRGEGDEAEVVLYAHDATTAERAFERASLAATLPGVLSPVQATASNADFGWVAVSETHVAPDEAVCILEAMKMESEIRAPRGGRVAKVLVEAGETVRSGEPLVALE